MKNVLQRLILFVGVCACILPVFAQQLTARQVLDKTAAVMGNRGGASASFVLKDPKLGKSTGTLQIKGDKFFAKTSQAMIWFNGKTQWSYLANTNEVSITNPTESQRMAMNPYTFINMYKQGYDLSMKIVGSNYQVALKAQGPKSIPEMHITVNKRTFVPQDIKIKRNGQWLTIAISKFMRRNFSDAVFSFNAKDFPSAEVIDLR